MGGQEGRRSRRAVRDRRIALSDEGKHAEAEAAFAKIAADGTGRLSHAGAAARSRRIGADAIRKAAVKAYDEIAADALARAGLAGSRRRARRHAAASIPRSLAECSGGSSRSPSRTAPSATPRAKCWRLSAWRNHDIAAARKYIDMIASDAETPRR